MTDIHMREVVLRWPDNRPVASFAVRSCTGDFIEATSIGVSNDHAELYWSDVWADFDLASEYRAEVYSALKINNYICDSCYDSAYNVTFEGFVH